MTPCRVVEITTPKKYLLRGLWFGPKKSKRVVVWVHGLGSSMFSKLEIATRLADSKTVVLVFNNRGHDKVAHLPHASGEFGKSLRGGSAHERFTDCVDDIQGAINFAKRNGGKEIYLAGHSTGCQKSVYWAYKKGRGVKGLVLLGPVSDYDAMSLSTPKKKLARLLEEARVQIHKGRGHDLLPLKLWYWPWVADAQRFESLYAGKGPEELFTYWDDSKKAVALEKIRLPILALLAEHEEFTRILQRAIATWFKKHTRKGTVKVIPKVGHSFRGGERAVVSAIRAWMK